MARVRRSGSRIRPRKRAAEERDLAGQRDVVDAEPGPWHALVEPEQPARADRHELLRGRLVLDDDRDRAEPGGEGLRQPVEDVVDTASKSTSSAGGDGSTIARYRPTTRAGQLAAAVAAAS